MGRKNYFPNPRFANDLGTWEMRSRMSRITNTAPVAYPAGMVFDSCMQWSDGGSWNTYLLTDIPVDPAVTCFSGQVYMAAGPAWNGSSVAIDMKQTDAGGATVYSYRFITGVPSKTEFLRVYSENIPKHPLCAYVSFSMAFPNWPGDSVYLTGMMLEPGAVSGTYADGSFTNWTWDGVANASPSSGVEVPPEPDPIPDSGKNSTNLILNPNFVDLKKWSRYGIQDTEYSDPLYPAVYSQSILPVQTPNGITTGLHYVSDGDEASTYYTAAYRMFPMVIRIPRHYRIGIWVYGSGTVAANVIGELDYYDANKVGIVNGGTVQIPQTIGQWKKNKCTNVSPANR